MKELISQDFRDLKKLLNYDFTENIFSLFVIGGSTSYSLISLLEGNPLTTLAYGAIAFFTYRNYYTETGRKMHEVKFEDKALTANLSIQSQDRIADNLSLYLLEHEIGNLELDNWELKKIKTFLEKKKLDNPTAFLISDMYKKRLETESENHVHSIKSTEKEKEKEKENELKSLEQEDPDKIINEIYQIAEENASTYQERMNS